jgi:hypothetical protein
MKTKLQKLLAVIGALASLGILAAGCGGGQDQSTRIIQAPEAPAKEVESANRPASFKDQANEMCAVLGRQKTVAIEDALEALAAEGKSGQKALEEVSSNVALPEVERMLRKLRRLQPPASEKAEFKKVIAIVDSDLRVANKQPAQFLSGEAFEPADKALVAFGLRSCVV